MSAIGSYVRMRKPDLDRCLGMARIAGDEAVVFVVS